MSFERQDRAVSKKQSLSRAIQDFDQASAIAPCRSKAGVNTFLALRVRVLRARDHRYDALVTAELACL